MSSIVNFDRDLTWCDLGKKLSQLSPQETWVSNLNIASDSVVYDKEASVSFYNIGATNTISSDFFLRSGGLHMQGPDLNDGSPYRIKGYVYIHDAPQYIVRLGMGIGPSSFSPSGVDTVVETLPILESTGFLRFDETIYLQPFGESFPGQGYEGRPISFFISYYRYTGVNTPSAFIGSFSLSVQSLAVKPRQYLTSLR